ncbi:MAG: aminotransferase class V-fold PLP-dependent enzyme [Verrucomicrobiaceae bacterium]|nr:aminotransferase class V-fold PLP-dependent enzyme [Verrucomicrobiaceae bacterium]
MLDDARRARDFPSLEGIAYLNTAAEGIPPLSVGEALQRYFSHKVMGMDGRALFSREFEACRESAAALLGLSAPEISFASSTSEAYNLLATAVSFAEGDDLVLSNLDFPSGVTPWLQHRDGPVVQLWEHRDGVLELDDLAAMLSERTRLVQVSLVSFLTGYRIPWDPFRDLVRERAPHALLAVDVTQAAGRVALDCLDADCLIASTYKWLLGTHGGSLVAVPEHARDRLVVKAGGWFHLANAFEQDRFHRAEPFPGVRGFAVGMPVYPAIYALRQGILTLHENGIPAIAAHADALVARLHEGLADLGHATLSPPQPGNSSGIVAMRTTDDAALHAHFLSRNIHVMHQAGRIRFAVHGYNRMADIDAVIAALAEYRG